MPRNSKFDTLSRSQIVIALTRLELRLERTKNGSDIDRQLRKERAELFEALREKDNALLEKWNRNAREPQS